MAGISLRRMVCARASQAEGFTVEEGSGGMPTAFSAIWSNGKGPAIMAYAEYDAVPGNCQIADTYRAPRQGLVAFCRRPYRSAFRSRHGRLDRRARRQGGHGEARHCRHHPLHGRARREGAGARSPSMPPEGYYDGLDAIISFHPFYMLPFATPAAGTRIAGPITAAIYEFLCERPETWLHEVDAAPAADPGRAHRRARSRRQ